MLLYSTFVVSRVVVSHLRVDAIRWVVAYSFVITRTATLLLSSTEF